MISSGYFQEMLKLIILSVYCVVEGNGNELDINQMNESSSINRPTTDCVESEKPQDMDPDTNEFNVAGSAKAVENALEANDAETANVDPELETNYQPSVPQLDTFNQSEQCSAAEVLSSAGNVQPCQPEVLDKKKKQTSGSRKRSKKLKQNTKALNTEVTEETWAVSSHDDNPKKNVVLIRRQHPTETSDTCPEFTACSVEEKAFSQSQVLCETTCDTEEKKLSSEKDEGDVLQQQVAAVSQEPVTVTETACSKADIPDKNVESFASTDGTDITGSQSAVVQPKRRRKMRAITEACRKSQRCSSRRKEVSGCVDHTHTSTSAAEATITSGSCKDAQNADDTDETFLAATTEDVLQEQVMSAQTSINVSDKTEPAAAVSDSAISQTEANVETSDPAVLRYNVTAASDENVVTPVASVTSTENTDVTQETTLQSQITVSVNRHGVLDISEDQSMSNSASAVSSSFCRDKNQPTVPIAIKQEVKIEQPLYNTWNSVGSSVAIKVENDAVKHESDCMNYNSPAADLNASSRPSRDTSLLDTCLSETMFDTMVSPAVHPRAADETDKEKNTGISEMSSSDDAAVINSHLTCEGESEAVCTTILAEVVASVVKDECLMSASEENVQNVESSLMESSGHASNTTMAQNELDSTSGEIPLKKRRGRRVFADCQPSDSVTAPHQNGDDRRPDVSAWASSHRRKTSSSSSHRHFPRGNKYVGAHTSVVGKLLGECHCVIRC